jgi:hypothetical protein
MALEGGLELGVEHAGQRLDLRGLSSLLAECSKGNTFGPPTRFSGGASAVATAETNFTPHTQLRRMGDWRNIVTV